MSPRYHGVITRHEGIYKGIIRKTIGIGDLKVVAIRKTGSGSEEEIWGLPESEIPRTWESWLITALPNRPDWTAAIRLEPDARGEFVAAELRVFPTETHEGDVDEDPRIRGEWSGALDAIPVGGIQVRDLRPLRIGEHVRKGGKAAKEAVSDNAEKLEAHAGRLGRVIDSKLQAWLEAIPSPPGASSGRGRRIPDLDHIYVAAIYVRHDDAGSNRPAADTASELGGDWTSGKVREWLRRARQRQLLTPAKQGLSGGRLTPEAEEILRDSQIATLPGD